MYISVCGGKWGIHIWGYTGPRSGIRGYVYMYMGACQNCGLFLGTLNIRGRITIGIQKGTIILTTTHIYTHVVGLSDFVVPSWTFKIYTCRYSQGILSTHIPTRRPHIHTRIIGCGVQKQFGRSVPGW